MKRHEAARTDSPENSIIEGVIRIEKDIQVVFTPEFYLIQIEALTKELEKKVKQIQTLEIELEYERNLRRDLENERVSTKKPDNTPERKTRKRREVTIDNKDFSDFKSDGKRKAHAADSIRSYDDFKAIQDYYLKKGSIRDWAMWTIGVSLGLRISDLLSLKFGNILEADKKSFKPRIQIYEFKTGKLNNLLITEAVKDAMTRYLRSIKWKFDLDGFLFPSKKTGGKMYEECGWRILSSAGKDLRLPLVIGSHTMRKSFANIAACVDKSCIDMNAITKVQGLLNHGDQKVTMTYLGAYQDMYDRARIAVSDFVLGKTEVNEIIAGNQYTIDDVFERMEVLENLLLGRGKENE